MPGRTRDAVAGRLLPEPGLGAPGLDDSGRPPGDAGDEPTAEAGRALGESGTGSTEVVGARHLPLEYSKLDDDPETVPELCGSRERPSCEGCSAVPSADCLGADMIAGVALLL